MTQVTVLTGNFSKSYNRCSEHDEFHLQTDKQLSNILEQERSQFCPYDFEYTSVQRNRVLWYITLFFVDVFFHYNEQFLHAFLVHY